MKRTTPSDAASSGSPLRHIAVSRRVRAAPRSETIEWSQVSDRWRQRDGGGFTISPAWSAFEARHPEIPVYAAALDERLDERAYILPGLGDAGDRYFGT